MGFGGGSSGGTTRTTATTTQELAPEQQELLRLVIPEATRFVENPPTLFPSTAIAGFTPLQEAGQQLTVNAAQNILPQQAQSANLASQFLLGPVLFPQSNPALAAATEAAIRPLTRTFEQSILPNIRSEAVQAGQFGGSRQGIAEGIAAQELIAQSGDVSSRIAASAFANSLDAMVAALQSQPALTGLSILPGQLLSAVGAEQRGLEQAQLSEEAQRFVSEQILPFLAAQEVASLAFGIPGGTTTTTGVGTSPGLQGPSGLQTALSLLAVVGAFAGGGLFGGGAAAGGGGGSVAPLFF